MKDFFKWQDFNEYIPEFAAVNPMTAEQMAGRANKKLNKLRAESLVVYGEPKSQAWSTVDGSTFNHKAVITFIERREQPECNHEPEIGHAEIVNALYSISLAGTVSKNITGAKCKYCGVKMRATWGVE